MEKDISFEVIDKKVQYLLDSVWVNQNLLTILDSIIDISDGQSNKEYMDALELFEKTYIVPTLN
jgi:hypothetical protein